MKNLDTLLREWIVDKLRKTHPETDAAYPFHIVASNYYAELPQWIRMHLFSLLPSDLPFLSLTDPSLPASPEAWDAFLTHYCHEARITPGKYIVFIGHLTDTQSLHILDAFLKYFRDPTSNLPFLSSIRNLPLIGVFTFRHWDASRQRWVHAPLEAFKHLDSILDSGDFDRVFLLDVTHPRYPPMTDPEDMFSLVGNLLCLLYDYAARGSDFTEWIREYSTPDRPITGYAGLTLHSPAVEVLTHALMQKASETLEQILFTDPSSAEVEAAAHMFIQTHDITHPVDTFRTHLRHSPPPSLKTLSVGEAITVARTLITQLDQNHARELNRELDEVREHLRWQVYFDVLQHLVESFSLPSRNLPYALKFLSALHERMAHIFASIPSNTPDPALRGEILQLSDELEQAYASFHHPSGVLLRSALLLAFGGILWVIAPNTHWIHWGGPALSLTGVAIALFSYLDRFFHIRSLRGALNTALQEYWRQWFHHHLSRAAQKLWVYLEQDLQTLHHRFQQIHRRFQHVLNRLQAPPISPSRSFRAYHTIPLNERVSTEEISRQIWSSRSREEIQHAVYQAVQERSRELVEFLVRVPHEVEEETLQQHEEDILLRACEALVPYIHLPQYLSPCFLVRPDHLEPHIRLLEHPHLTVQPSSTPLSQSASVLVFSPLNQECTDSWKASLDQFLQEHLAPSHYEHQTHHAPAIQIHALFSGIFRETIQIPDGDETVEDLSCTCGKSSCDCGDPLSSDEEGTKQNEDPNPS